jgi:DNA-binding transcriptional ArsR family regulator
MDKPNLAEEVNMLHAELCSALADPTRIMLIYALSEQSCNVSELATRLSISQPAASRHLKVLHDRGLVRRMRTGANVVYSLTDMRLVSALDLLREILRDRIAYGASIMEHE